VPELLRRNKEAAKRQEIVQWTILAKERAGAQAVFALAKIGEFENQYNTT
jgi:hypothetical protein